MTCNVPKGRSGFSVKRTRTDVGRDYFYFLMNGEEASVCKGWVSLQLSIYTLTSGKFQILSDPSLRFGGGKLRRTIFITLSNIVF